MRFYTAITCAAAAMMLAGCAPKAAPEAIIDSTILVRTDTAVKQNVALSNEYTTTLEPYKKTFIAPNMQVRIDRILVEVGDRVSKGQVLVEMDKSQLNQSTLQLKNSEINLARMKAVYEAGGASKQSIDEMETSIDVMQEALGNLEQNLQLTAPFDGVVTGRYNEAGDLFMMAGNQDGGVGILQVMQTSTLKAIVAVQEQYILQVKKGMPVRLTADVFPGEEFSGKVSLVYPSVDAATRTFKVEISIPNGSQKLKPGLFARASFDFGERESVVISDLAVQKQSGTSDRYVYVIDNQVAERRIVEIGRQIGDRIEILSGVEEGEQVAVTSLSKLAQGTEVVVSND